MSKKVIAVNGQHLSLNDNGGAGRYAQQIYKRLVDSTVKTLTAYDIRTLNFLNLGRKNNEKPDSAKVASLLKRSLYQCTPPVVFNILQKAYQSAKEYFPKISQGTDIHCAEPVTVSNDIANIRLLHELTNYMSHSAIGRLSLSSKISLAVTFLDIQDFYYPEYFKDDVLKKRRMKYSFYKDRADVFFAISEFTKQTMIEKLGIDPSKIKVIPLAADDLLILRSSQDINKWAESFGRFWIYPAKAWRHKNHDFLIKSLGKRKYELKRAKVKLLLTGGFSEKDLIYLSSIIKNNELGDIVIILGFVSDEQLQALLKRAEFLLFPSLFEGFGMPILEAMTLGCPVISSNAGSLPEVAGDSAVFFNPTDEDEFVDLTDSILAETKIDRTIMIQKGFQNCKRFSWDNTYSATVKAYKELLQ